MKPKPYLDISIRARVIAVVLYLALTVVVSAICVGLAVAARHVV